MLVRSESEGMKEGKIAVSIVTKKTLKRRRAVSEGTWKVIGIGPVVSAREQFHHTCLCRLLIVACCEKEKKRNAMFSFNGLQRIRTT